MDYKKVAIEKFPPKMLKVTPEQRFWKKYDIYHKQECSEAINKIVASKDRNLFVFSHGMCV